MGAIGLAVLAVVAVACNKAKPDTSPVPQLMPRVSITSVKGDVESELMAAIYARVLENTGVRVTRVDPVSMDRGAYYKAMQDGQFQMIPEFSHDLLSFLLDATPTDSTPSTTNSLAPATTQEPVLMPTTTTVPATTVPTTDTSGAGSTTTQATTTTIAATTTTAGSTTTTTVPPTNANSLMAQIVAINSTLPNTLIAYAATLADHRPEIACTPAAIKAVSTYQLYTLTNLASLAPQMRLGVTAAYRTDKEAGLPELLRFYAPEFKSVDTIETAAMGAAIDAGTVDCVAVDSFDPLIATKNLRIILDDKYMSAANAAIVLMASTVNLPEVTAALDKVTTALSTEKLARMLNEIAANGTNITVVANAFADNL